ncbi:MAG: ABC transporter permease, partial [Armatimonadetes bacterium]|nr:ABC transporter permease [Armatimonadota bacterium]
FRFLAGGGEPLGRHDVWLNRWVATDLGAQVGDPLELTTLVPSWEGAYREETHRFTVRGIVALEGAGADPTLVPPLAGITDADRVDTWQAPFPVEMSRITPRDEAYWEQYRAAPKVFVAPETARALWRRGASEEESDWITSVRITPGGGEAALGALARQLGATLATRLEPESAGLRFRPVRQEAIEAARGSTSFAHLFLGMSFFLVAAAAGLAGMTMRLLADRRAAEAGVLLACGFDERSVRRAIQAEGAILATVGALAGIPLGALYAAAVLKALATRWIGAVGTPALWLHLDAVSLLGGGLAGLLVGGAAAAGATRQTTRRPVLELLAGWQAADLIAALRPARWADRLRWPALAGAILLTGLALLGVVPSAGAFFGSGALLLAAALGTCQRALWQTLRHPSGTPSLPAIALRSAGANRGRSLLVLGLFAAAGFILVAAAANIRDASSATAGRRDSGTGGFALRAVSTLPIPYDFGTPGGRERLGFPPEEEALFEGVTVVPFLASPGDDISCLNPTRPAAPRLLGVLPAMVARGGFRVVGPAARAGNPWTQLDAPAPDGALPAFGDAESVQWTLHSGPGKRWSTVVAGQPTELWFAGVLPSSLFAGELLISERHFRRLFPSIAAPRYFLVAVPPGKEQAVAASLRRNLGDLGLEVRPTREILNELKRVQNTY